MQRAGVVGKFYFGIVFTIQKRKKKQQSWSIKTSFSRNFVGEKLSKGLIEAK